MINEMMCKSKVILVTMATYLRTNGPGRYIETIIVQIYT